MPVTVCVVANIFNEASAISGFIENVSSWADDVRILHAGPGGEYSTDGTLEILERWKIPVEFCAIDAGFGAIRTKALRMSRCDWTVLLDADERIHPHAPVLDCQGENTPPDVAGQILYDYDRKALETTPGTACASNWENLSQLGATLEVSAPGDVYAQTAWLRQLMESGGCDAIKTVRRHWHDFSWRRPTQNWKLTPDYQCRIVKNVDHIHFNMEHKMHEQIVGASSVYAPDMTHGPFFDHYHLWFKRMEAQQRRHDVAIYDSLHHGRKVPTWAEFKGEKHGD